MVRYEAIVTARNATNGTSRWLVVRLTVAPPPRVPIAPCSPKYRADSITLARGG